MQDSANGLGGVSLGSPGASGDIVIGPEIKPKKALSLKKWLLVIGVVVLVVIIGIVAFNTVRNNTILGERKDANALLVVAVEKYNALLFGDVEEQSFLAYAAFEAQLGRARDERQKYFKELRERYDNILAVIEENRERLDGETLEFFDRYSEAFSILERVAGFYSGVLSDEDALFMMDAYAASGKRGLEKLIGGQKGGESDVERGLEEYNGAFMASLVTLDEGGCIKVRERGLDIVDIGCAKGLLPDGDGLHEMKFHIGQLVSGMRNELLPIGFVLDGLRTEASGDVEP